MNVKQLKKIMKPTVRAAKKVYLIGYIEDSDTVTITYSFKGQKDSHLKIDLDIWNGMHFEQEEESNKVIITNLNGLQVKTNINGWSRLITESDAEEEIDE